MKIYLKLIIHAIYWLVYGSFSFAVSVAQQGDDWPLIGDIKPHYYINFLWAIVAFYLFYFYFIKYFERRQFVLYLFFSVLVSIGLTFVFMPVHKIFFSGFNITDYHIIGPPMAGTFIILQTGILVRGFENWFSNMQIKAELENQKLKGELEFLKAQVNPHFLFNTLNNIDSLISKEPVKASKALITLSEIMRYMLYETASEKVSLEQEILNIRNVISLQSLRFRQSEYVTFKVNGTSGELQVAPLIFIPFIENAFKFAHYSREVPVISISFEISNTQIVFHCSNYFDPDKASSLNGNSGLGLANLRKQLLLVYPNRHELKIEKNNNKFEVALRIDLAS